MLCYDPIIFRQYGRLKLEAANIKKNYIYLKLNLSLLKIYRGDFKLVFLLKVSCY